MPSSSTSPVLAPLSDVSEVIYEILIAELAAQNLVQSYHRFHKPDGQINGNSLVFAQLRKTPNKSAISIVKFRYSYHQESIHRILRDLFSSSFDYTVYVVDDEMAAKKITSLLFSGKIDELVRQDNISVARSNIYIEFFRPQTTH
ncbi:hypothetical protein H4R33_006790 [Dimargaris cristalligena]|nr:hypothetical protein H4R33_006790 [Dimargaris cristalligena]